MDVLMPQLGETVTEGKITQWFKAAGDAVYLAPALVGLGWDMVTIADGTVAGSGYDVIVLDDDGRILLDHQHIAPS